MVCEHEGCFSVIPLARVMYVTPSLKEGDNIQVLWKNMLPNLCSLVFCKFNLDKVYLLC